jgi:hypothetical protein
MRLEGSIKRLAKVEEAALYICSVAPLPEMVHLLWTIFFLGAFQSAISKPLELDKRWDDLKVKHEWIDVPKGWVEVGRPPADYLLKMNVGLKQERFDELLDHLYQISDPEHHRCALIYPSFDQYTLTPPERLDTETISRKTRSTNSSPRTQRPSNLSKLG